jgi:glyoxylase-like metal-dependent hydrolase (beta-lactamase superfamily II)
VCYDTGDSLITGDTLFAEGFGRYDLYGGNLQELKASIKRLTEMAQSQSRWLYAGHGEASTLRKATENLKYYF